jgi:hypothetical protein
MTPKHPNSQTHLVTEPLPFNYHLPHCNLPPATRQKRKLRAFLQKVFMQIFQVGLFSGSTSLEGAGVLALYKQPGKNVGVDSFE